MFIYLPAKSINRIAKHDTPATDMSRANVFFLPILLKRSRTTQ